MQDDERDLPHPWRRTTPRIYVHPVAPDGFSDCTVYDGVPMTVRGTPQLPVLEFLPLFAHVRFWMMVREERLRILPAGNDLVASLLHAEEHAGFAPYVTDTVDGCAECAALRTHAERATHA